MATHLLPSPRYGALDFLSIKIDAGIRMSRPAWTTRETRAKQRQTKTDLDDTGGTTGKGGLAYPIRIENS